MRDNSMNSEAKNAMVRNVMGHPNMVAVTRLVNIEKSVCLPMDHLLVVTTERK